MPAYTIIYSKLSGGVIMEKIERQIELLNKIIEKQNSIIKEKEKEIDKLSNRISMYQELMGNINNHIKDFDIKIGTQCK